MKRRIKPILLNLFIVGILLFLIFLMYENIFERTQEDTNSNIEVKLLDSEVLTLTQLMLKTSDICNRGPRPKPEKIAYITIDDGPSKYTSEILDILDSNNVKGTFFMLNNNMISHKEEVNRIIKEGHGFGFHGVSHDVEKLYKTVTSSVEEFDTCNNTLYEISGKTSKLIRLPYGSKPYTPKENYDNLIKNNYLIWDWTLDTQDWKSSTDQIVSNILYYGRKKEEIVILMHEKEQTVKALNDIIKVLKVRGYDILPITENISPKNFWLGNTKG